MPYSNNLHQNITCMKNIGVNRESPNFESVSRAISYCSALISSEGNLFKSSFHNLVPFSGVSSYNDKCGNEGHFLWIILHNSCFQASFDRLGRPNIKSILYVFNLELFEIISRVSNPVLAL